MRKTEDVSFQFEKEEKISENIVDTSDVQKEQSHKKTSGKNKYFKEKKGPWEVVYEWMDSFVFSIILIFLVFVFGFRIVGVDGESMMPTLNHGDWLAVKAINTNIERGDIVVITQPNITKEPLVKRVIAVGGDTLDINFTSGEVKVNGEIIDEPYIYATTHNPGDFDKPIRIPEGYLFVMGDNRENSLDSRDYRVGLVEKNSVIGKKIMRLWPIIK